VKQGGPLGQGGGNRGKGWVQTNKINEGTFEVTERTKGGSEVRGASTISHVKKLTK